MTEQQPSVGRIVHYRSFGTPGGEFTPECRAAVITAVHASRPVPEHGVPYVSLFVMNPNGVYLDEDCLYDDGAEVSGSPDCPDKAAHGNPFRYCACGWRESALAGGTWHWPERV